MPAPRYEIRDRQNPQARGMRFSTIERARRELSHAYPLTRWYIFDRTAKREVTNEYAAIYRKETK